MVLPQHTPSTVGMEMETGTGFPSSTSRGGLPDDRSTDSRCFSQFPYLGCCATESLACHCSRHKTAGKFWGCNGATQKVSKLRETPRARARKAIKVYAFSSSSQWVQGRREPTLSTVEWSLEVLSSGNSDHGPRLNSNIQQGGQPGILGHYRVSCCTHSHSVQLHQ